MNVYSDVKITKVPGFTMGRYVIISPNPEDDVHAYMEAWHKEVDFYLLQMVSLHVLDGTSHLYLQNSRTVMV